jgi:hypothetical protein
MTVDRRRAATALALDVASEVLFVAIGRRSHDEGSAIGELARTLGPFAIAMLIGWAVTRAWRSPRAIVSGTAIWVITVALGMVLRRFVFDRGTAASFVVVTTIFLGLCLLGWRGIARLLAQRQNSTATAGTS